VEEEVAEERLSFEFIHALLVSTIHWLMPLSQMQGKEGNPNI